MVRVIGWDIGGANTKAAFLQTNCGLITTLTTATKYFPMWKEHEKLSTMLSELKKNVADSAKIDCMSVTMTAELSDSYRTKREGVNDILTHFEHTFPKTEILVLDANSQLLTLNQARLSPFQVAAANWAATGWMVSKLVRNCLILDVGSTTTSIIPVVDGAIVAQGKTDLEKLINGELIYTGSLRTNVAGIVSRIPTRKGSARVSPELFALSGDIHLILGNIVEEDYTVETADGKGITRAEALTRLARVVCADSEMLDEGEIVNIAHYVYERQIKQVASGLRQVCDRVESLGRKKAVVVVTGLGRNFLARRAAEQLGFEKILDLEELVKGKIAKVSTAVGVALMCASKLEGKTVKWTP